MPNVTIVGPNLRDQSKGSFHVHDANCRDVCRYHRDEETFTVELDSEQAVVEFMYECQIEENEGDETYGSWEGYRDDFHFLPCCKF